MKRFLALLIACALLLCGCQRDMTFSPEKWREDPDNRVRMVENLLDRYDLVGMTENEVHVLLGKPSDTSYFKRENRLVYYMGFEKYNIDASWLLIDFVDGVVSEYFVTTD